MLALLDVIENRAGPFNLNGLVARDSAQIRLDTNAKRTREAAECCAPRQTPLARR
jgi:hypothetical protein